MPSNFDLLREGKTAKGKDGTIYRLNQQDKTLESSKGFRSYVGDDPDFFPQNEEQLAESHEKESLERDISKRPFGEFLYQFGEQGVAGAAKNWYNKLTKTGDDYLRSKKIGSQVSQRISEESPYTSAAATAASFVPDIALTKGMSAAKAAPTLAALHAGPRIIEEPENVAQEALLSAGAGYFIDKGAQALNKMSNRRAAARELPAQQEAARQQSKAALQGVQAENQARKQTYETMLQNRSTQIAKEKTDFASRKAAQEAEIIRLENEARMAKFQRSENANKAQAEYKAAKEAWELENKTAQEKFKLDEAKYKDDLKRLPELQKQAQIEHGNTVVANAREIESAFPKGSKIFTDELEVPSFIDESINKTGLGGTPAANQARRTIRAIFPEGEILESKELSKRYRALEDAIQRASPEVQSVLDNFKTHLGQRLPSVLENNFTYSKLVPVIQKSMQKEVNAALRDINLGDQAVRIHRLAESNAKNALSTMSPSEIVNSLKEGTLADKLANKILKSEDFLIDRPVQTRMTQSTRTNFDILQNLADENHKFFVNQFVAKLEPIIAKNELKIAQEAKLSSSKFKENIKETYGVAKPLAEPIAPTIPELRQGPLAPHPQAELPPIQHPAPITPPILPAMPQKPSLLPQPPITPEPTLAPPQGLAERTGDFLEKNLLGGKSLVNNPLTKLGALKYVLGKGAVPLEAAYLGMKGLTSPTVAGEAARMTFKQGGIQAIVSWMQRYPSYHDGILEAPQDRRSMTKEIEEAGDIPLEQKALLQSKVNRGKPLEGHL